MAAGNFHPTFKSVNFENKRFIKDKERDFFIMNALADNVHDENFPRMLLCHYRFQSLAAFSKQSASEILANSSGMNGTFLFLFVIINNIEKKISNNF